MNKLSVIMVSALGLLVACTPADQTITSSSQIPGKLPVTATMSCRLLPTKPPVTLPAEPTAISTNEPVMLTPTVTTPSSEEIDLPVLTPNVRIGKGVPTSLAVSPDGRWMAVGTQFGVYQYHADTFKQAWLTPLPDKAGPMVFDPQSKRLGVSSSSSSAIVILDVATGSLINRLEDAGSSFAWSPDGSRLVSGSGCEQVTIWDTNRGISLIELLGGKCSEGYSGIVVTWAADGRIYAASMGTKILAWDGDTYTPIEDFPAEGAPNTWISALLAAPTGTLLAQYDSMGLPIVAIIDGQQDRQLHLLDRQVNGRIAAIAWAPDGYRLAVNYNVDAGLTLIWNATTGQLEQEIDGFYATAGLGFSPDGQTLFGLQSLDGQIDAVDLSSESSLRSLDGHLLPGIFLTWTQDGLVSTDGATLTWWDPDNGQPLRKETIGFAPAWMMLWPQAWVMSWPPAGPGQYLYSDSLGGYKVGTPASSHAITGEKVQNPFPSAWSWDGSRLADPIRVWDARSGEILVRLHDPAQQHAADKVAWSPDGEHLASVESLDVQPPFIWDAYSGEILHSLKLNADNYEPLWLELAWSPDGKHLAAVGSLMYLIRGGPEKGMILLWNAETAQQEQLLTAGMINYRLWAVAWSPDSRFMAVGSTGRDIFLWDIARNKPLAKLGGHTDISDQLAWSPDGSCLASVARDGTLVIWDLASILPEAEKAQK